MASFEGDISLLHQHFHSTPSEDVMFALSRTLISLDRNIEETPIAKAYKQRLRELVRCMSAYAVESVPHRVLTAPHRLNSYYIVSLQNNYKRYIQYLQRARGRILRCIDVLHRTQEPRLRKAISIPQLRRDEAHMAKVVGELLGPFQAMTAMRKAYVALQSHSPNDRKALASVIKDFTRMHLRFERAWIRYRLKTLHTMPDFHERIERLRTLWKLRPAVDKTPHPLDLAIPFSIQMSLSVVLPLGVLAVIGNERGKQSYQTISPALWGIAGASVSLLAGTPALAMLLTPQPLGVNLTFTMCLAAILPALGISMVMVTGSSAINAAGWGILSSLPIHALWLSLGWVNQARWHKIRKNWTHPPPKPIHLTRPSPTSMLLTTEQLQ